MNKLIMLVGIPGSGKSTWAKEQVTASGGRVKRVNRDDLRAMIDCGQWSKANEKLIVEVRNRIIVESLRRFNDVIVDDTNLTRYHERDLRNLLDELTFKPEFEVKVFDTPFEVCVERNAKREGRARVPDNDMLRMRKDFESWQANYS